jgi:hypothetical protein
MPRLSHEVQKHLYESDKRKLIAWFTEDKWDIIYQHFYEQGNSLRVHDYFVTTYCLEHPCIIMKDGEYKDIYICSQNWLKRFRKRNFDAFCRKNKIMKGEDVFEFGYTGKKVSTTVCQLFFYQFVLEYDLIRLVTEKAEDIAICMKRDKPGKTSDGVKPKKPRYAKHSAPVMRTIRYSHSKELGPLIISR